MLGTRFLCMLSILCCSMMSLVLGKNYDYGVNITEELKAKRASSDTVVVTRGMPLRANGSVPVRYEIRDLQNDADKWTLYILALDMMQYTDQSVVTSWFSISGGLQNPNMNFLSDGPFPDNFGRNSWCTFPVVEWCPADIWQRGLGLLSARDYPLSYMASCICGSLRGTIHLLPGCQIRNH